MKRKICVVVTARPSYSRVKTALQAIKDHPHLELQLVVGASALLHNYGNTVNYIKDDGFEIAARVYMVIEGGNPLTSAKSTGLGLVELATIFDNLRPNVVVTIADRYETLATAIAASYMNIPVAHIQGGEVTGSIDEKVRHAVTKLSNLHFVSTEKARERVIRMGEHEETVHLTGCPSLDLVISVLRDPRLDFDPFKKYGGVGPTFDYSDGYTVVLQHSVTTEYRQSRRQVAETLAAVHESGLPAFWFWPNVDAGSDGTSKGIRVFREKVDDSCIHFFRNMMPHDFLKFIYNSKCLIGNSSAGIRECSLLGVPTVNIGSRQNGRERGANVVDVEHNSSSILAAIKKQTVNGRYKPDYIYGNGQAGNNIAALLASEPLSIEKVLAY